MKYLKTSFRNIIISLASVLALHDAVVAADHNDPNAVNSIFSDVPLSPGDLYDIFGFPSSDTSNGEAILVALTFSALPKAGTFDRDFMYQIHLQGAERGIDLGEVQDLEDAAKLIEGLGHKYLDFKGAKIAVSFNSNNQAKVEFVDFPGGDFNQVVDTNKVLSLKTPKGQTIKAYLGGRDDAFFNDLPGFFRSINYGPQFYHIPATRSKEMREFPIPKTLLELEGNTLFNYDEKNPQLGKTVKMDLPPNASLTWSGNKYLKDKDGNFRFVYSGEDARAGQNINALIFEIPLSYITNKPTTDRIVRTWGDSYVLKASSKVPKYAPSMWGKTWLSIKSMFHAAEEFNSDLSNYNLVDHDGLPFGDAALGQREDSKARVNNLQYSREFVIRFGHLGWGFGPSVSALGLPTCFDHDNSPISKYVMPKLATEVFPRVKKCFFQKLNMPDNSWNKSGLNIPLKRTYEVFIPNLTSVDMDTTGTWPFGRRPEDQVATRFLATFLDMSALCGGKQCSIETLNDPALWASAPITPKTPPNPLKNDKPFLDSFPYLAEPWPELQYQK